MPKNLITDLLNRRLIHDSTDQEKITEHLQTAQRTIYVGFDPTADSLHIGSLLPLITLKRVLKAGHKGILLLGGGTGLIGDPSGKNQERSLESQEKVKRWGICIGNQLTNLFKNEKNFKIVDNFKWIDALSLLSYLRDIGKEFTINYMVGKDSVSSRFNRSGEGISYTEFSYMILQAYDFFHLYQHHGCTIQIGGSDQWGNITAGCELIRRKLGKSAHGFTIPLITKSDGTKFGKTEQGTVWLDSKKTSPYHFYQFWINCSDVDILNFIDSFSLADDDVIEEIKQRSQKDPEKRHGQTFLAKELTELVHGKDKLQQAIHISHALFSNHPENLTKAELEQLATSDFSTKYNPQEHPTLVELLVSTGLVKSKRTAREMLQNKAITINKSAVGIKTDLSALKPLCGKYLVCTKGKKHHHIIIV